uniref:Uncharacterized protein n=1 Tax=Cacopsylla melanoneura TaxID=428564 RepID=A0A8D8PMG1_9HEMI
MFVVWVLLTGGMVLVVVLLVIHLLMVHVLLLLHGLLELAHGWHVRATVMGWRGALLVHCGARVHLMGGRWTVGVWVVHVMRGWWGQVEGRSALSVLREVVSSSGGIVPAAARVPSGADRGEWGTGIPTTGHGWWCYARVGRHLHLFHTT